MSWTDILTESTAALAPSGNPLGVLPPRERAVLVLLGSGLEATTVAKLLHISRETLYQDRRHAWQSLRPVIRAEVDLVPAQGDEFPDAHPGLVLGSHFTLF